MPTIRQVIASKSTAVDGSTIREHLASQLATFGARRSFSVNAASSTATPNQATSTAIWHASVRSKDGAKAEAV